MIQIEIIACGKVQLIKQVSSDDSRMMSTLKALRENKAAQKRGRGRPPRVQPNIVQIKVK
jgi:hypothetical protein